MKIVNYKEIITVLKIIASYRKLYKLGNEVKHLNEYT